MSWNKSIIIDKWKRPIIPFDKIQIGDIVVVRYIEWEWQIENKLSWENWHHAWLVSEIWKNNIKVIETPWDIYQWKLPAIWPVENNFYWNSLYTWKDVKEIIFLKPKFPNPIREKWKWYVPRIFHKIISEIVARKRVIKYAKNQIWEPYSFVSSKWNENEWYCSKLLFKAYSMTIYDMYLETYHFPFLSWDWKFSSWPWVTPEDLVDSRKTISYYHYIKNK